MTENIEDQDKQPVAEVVNRTVDKQKLFLPVSILLAALLISGSLIYTRSSDKTPSVLGQGEDSAKPVDVSVDDDPVLGNSSAKVTIVEFSDFQCPFCRKFWRETLPSLKKDYIDTGKAKFVYRDFPLSGHPSAHITAIASECADDQGKYWQMHDKIFQEQDKKGEGTVTYSADDLKRWAKEAGLNNGQFNQCLDSQKYKAEVDKDFEDGTKAGVTGTPTLFINGRKVVGAQPFSAFASIIEEELKNSSKKSFFK